MAAYVELTLEQGADFNTTVNVRDGTGVATNLSSYQVAAQLRKSHYSTSAVNFTVQVTDSQSGEITMSMNASTTSTVTPGRYVYDLLITSPTNVKTRVIEGIVNVLPSVTR